MVAWARGLILVAAACAITTLGCGDDDSGGKAPSNRSDASDMPDKDASTPPPKPMTKDAGTKKPDAGHHTMMDAGKDADVDNPFAYDANGDYPDAIIPEDQHPMPAEWSCAASMWQDGICDCGCSAHDFDCTGVSCSTPGCIEAACGACFSVTGAWMPCAPEPQYDPNDWTCDPSEMNDASCDCGCGIPDPTCHDEGCTTPGCRTSACDVRHGCGPGVTSAEDTCAGSLPAKWKCPWAKYGSGDGCDCGCGLIDPDCAASAGCTDALCFDAACNSCNDKFGRPYSCDALEAGWNSGAGDGEYCSGVHFDSGDGCDCGCGGVDPDCGNAGCTAAGCDPDDSCVRCTTSATGKPTGCVPFDDPAAQLAWPAPGSAEVMNACTSDNYGTGDGCDCGCGSPDPDCKGGGSIDASFTADCDVCHGSGTGSVNGYMQCPGWTCGDADQPAWANAECDCGCGVIDPFCRADGRVSCTSPGCESPVCEYCNDDSGQRTACGGTWTTAVPSTCNKSYYGLDGLCDCGCGSIDPDCPANTGCSEVGCVGEACEVCHASIGGGMRACLSWSCDPAAYASGDGCDCGCGAEDPDCAGGGCETPGCRNDVCETCHDPYGRVVPCP